MLDPDLVLAAVLAAFRSIPLLVAEMADDVSNIYGHDYLYGAETSLALAVNNQRSPSILVAYLDILGGQFSGMQVWKHRLDVFIRPKNAATGSVGSPPAPASSPQRLWWLMLTQPVLGGAQDFLNTELMTGLMILADIPSLTHQQDEQGADFFIGHLSIGEKGL